MDGITLWTRLGGGYRSDRKLMLEISPDPDFRRVVYRRNVVARASKDHALTVRVRDRALRPGERYHYRFHTREVEGPVGRFRTLRPADSNEPVRVAFFSCQKWTVGHYGAHRTIADLDDVDLVVCLGDYIYETGGRDVREDKTGEAGTGFVETLAGYRDKYRLYRSDEDLQAMHAAHPFMAIWDDHEVENDYAGDVPGTARQRSVEFPERRHNGYRTFFDYMPFGRVGPGFGLYRSVRIGRTAELFLLDERQYREDQPCDNEEFVPCPEADDPGRDMLGAEQLAWLKRGLESSPATWKILANQVMAMALETARGQAVNKDQWDGYAAERADLLGHVRDRGIGGVTILTGDIHSFFAGEVGVEGRGPESVATEFVGGSVTSLGLPEEVEERTGAPLTPEQVETLANIRAFNPHIKYDELKSRGYGVLEARPDELLVEFRAVDARERSTEARTIGRFRVAKGAPRVEVLDPAP